MLETIGVLLLLWGVFQIVRPPTGSITSSARQRPEKPINNDTLAQMQRLDGVASIFRFATHLPLWILLQQSAQLFAQQGAVIHDQNAHLHRLNFGGHNYQQVPSPQIRLA